MTTVPLNGMGDKFRELLLYVARLAESDPRCGATKLNKILFYTDFTAYRSFGRSISGQSYRKLDHGPAPKGILPAVDALAASGSCAWAERSYFGFPLRRLVALREPDLSQFSPQEIDLVNRVIRDLWDLNATEVSDLSHRFVGWQVAELGEEISYDSVFVGEPRPLTDEETSWALDAIQEFREQPSS